jgi:hypothetical protein
LKELRFIIECMINIDKFGFDFRLFATHSKQIQSIMFAHGNCLKSYGHILPEYFRNFFLKAYLFSSSLNS